MEKKTTNMRAYSTEFSDHRDLICKMAQKGWGRLQSAGVVIDFDDVFQEMSISYLKAARCFNPEVGFTFTAYLGRAIWNEFNKFAERLIRDQCGLGLVRVQDIGDDEQDTYEILSDDSALSPEQLAINRESFRESMLKLNVTERTVVAKMMRQTIAGSEDKSMTEIMESLNLSASQRAKARRNINTAFGINV